MHPPAASHITLRVRLMILTNQIVQTFQKQCPMNRLTFRVISSMLHTNISQSAIMMVTTSTGSAEMQKCGGITGSDFSRLT